MGMLSHGDRITMNRERLLLDAKHQARDMANAGYAAPPPRTDIPAPGENVLATLKLGVHLMREGPISSAITTPRSANWVAHVLCGGKSHPALRSPSSIFWTWSARRSFRWLAKRKPRSGSPTRSKRANR